MHRQDLLGLLKGHNTRFMDEAGFVARGIRFVEGHEDCFCRELWPMHVTGSAWVVNPGRNLVLMVHHKKLDRWFQPGGHADGDSDIVRVALKEISEETGVDPSQVKLVSMDVFDVDIHRVPANPVDGAPEHEHIDIRFLIEIDDRLPLPGSDESHDVRWVRLYEVSRYNNNRSTFRMVEKTRRLRPMNLFQHTA